MLLVYKGNLEGVDEHGSWIESPAHNHCFWEGVRPDSQGPDTHACICTKISLIPLSLVAAVVAVAVAAVASFHDWPRLTGFQVNIKQVEAKESLLHAIIQWSQLRLWLRVYNGPDPNKNCLHDGLPKASQMWPPHNVISRSPVNLMGLPSPCNTFDFTYAQFSRIW